MLGVVVVPSGFDARTPIGGLPPLLRHALSLQAAGAREVRLVGADAPVPDDARLGIPVGRGGAIDDAAIVVPADATCHRLLPTRLAALAVGPDETIRVGDGPACFMAGSGRAAAVVEALVAGETPEARRLALDPGEFVLPASTPDERDRALSPHLVSLKKPTAGALDRHLMRPISLQITRVLCRTRIGPNHVSLVCLLLGLGGAALVAFGSAVGAAVGALLFIVLRIVDCVDGELARLRYEGTKFGEWFDTVGDGIGIASLLAAATYRLHWTGAHPAWAVVGVVGVVSYVVMQLIQYRALLSSGGRGGLQMVQWGHRRSPRTRFERFASRIDVVFREDFASVFFSVMILVGQLEAMLLVQAAAATGASVYFLVQLVGRRTRVPAG